MRTTWRRAGIVALAMALAWSGAAWAAAPAGNEDGDRTPIVWEFLWSEVREWLRGLDGSDRGPVGIEGNSESGPPPVPIPPPESSTGGDGAETDGGGMLDPNG